MPIRVGKLGTVAKSLVKRLKELKFTGRTETMQTTALWSAWSSRF